MTINIRYFKQFSREYKDLIIVLSKFSELKNIKNLPFDVLFLAQNRELEKFFKENHYYESIVSSHRSRSFYKIKLILIENLKNNHSIFEGAKLFSKLKDQSSQSLNFIFSSRLINNYNNLCSNLIFGLLLKSYSFSKYKKRSIYS